MRNITVMYLLLKKDVILLNFLLHYNGDLWDFSFASPAAAWNALPAFKLFVPL